MAERRTIDLSGTTDATKAGDYTPLPKGWYSGFIYEAEEKETGPNSKNPGSPYLKLRLNVDGSVTNEDEGAGRVIFDNFVGLYVTEAAPHLANKAEQLARVVGVWDGEDREEVVLPEVEDLEGEEVEFLLKLERDTYAEEQYEDEHGEEPEEPIFRNSVSAYRPVGGWPKPGAKGKKKGKSKNVTL